MSQVNFEQHTPVEKYNIKGIDVWVKRDDLYLAEYQDKGAPALSKLRGASLLLRKLKEQGCKKIGVYDTAISKAGQGLSFLCKELGMECMCGFPLPKGTEIAESKLIAEKNGAILYPLVAGRTNICYYRFKKTVEESGGYMLPLGLVCKETVECVRNEASDSFSRSNIPYPNSIVLSVGSGTITTGVCLGAKKAKVYGVSCGMANSKQARRINMLAYPEVIWNLILIPPSYDYYFGVNIKDVPFPTSKYYDGKAWNWLVDHIEELEQPIFFWNIGV